MRKQFTLLLLVVLSTCSISLAQSLEQSLFKYNQFFPQEKVYVHFDNSAYLPGQLIGFKAYLMSGPEPSKLNRNFYTDWYDENGTLLAHQVSPIALSSAYGTFELPASYKGKHVYVSAYTQWMLNFDSTLIFQKKLEVLQTSPLPTNKIVTLPSYALQFMPEGGNLINGLLATVAFKALDKEGMPIKVQGRIVNDKLEEVAQFQSTHNGMGKFPFIPQLGETYTAEWKDPDGLMKKTALPKALNDGVSMRLSSAGIYRSLEVERTSNLPESFRKLTMIVSINQQMVVKASVNLEQQQKVATRIPVFNFPSGIATVTLLTANNQPLCERLIFIDNEEYQADVRINLNTVGLTKRAKNEYEIQLPDSVPANMSLAITNDDVAYDSADHIISSLLLSADIKGKVHQPAYYFNAANDSAKHHLDLVMLTHGWRRFKWDQVLDSSTWKIKYPLDTAYLTLSGKVDGVNASRLTKSETMNLILKGKDSTTQLSFVPVTPNGIFSEPNIVFYDSATLFYQLNKIPILPGRGKVTIRNSLIDTAYQKKKTVPFMYSYDLVKLNILRQAALEQEKLQALLKGTTLEDVTVTGRRKTRFEEMDETYTNGLFRGSDAVSFDIINDPRGISSVSVFDYLQSRVAGLQINGALTPTPSAVWRGAPVGLFLNEMNIDAQFLSSIPMSDVAYIKVFRPPFIGGVGGGAGGAIVVYTRKGNEGGANFKGLDNTIVVGYTPVKEFYEPDYASPDQSYQKTDTRRTLYWKPNIITDGTVQKINISFYNNDISRKIRVVLEGVNSEGQFISVRKLLQ